MKMPCMCGADDCGKCYPNQPKQERDYDPVPEVKYNWKDKDNEWMDYICEGYQDSPY